MSATARIPAISRHLSQNANEDSSGAQAPNQLPWNPSSSSFPALKDLPPLPNAPAGAAWVWGEDDQLGRLNLLTPARVKASVAEIKTGEIIPLNLPLNMPEKPAFERETFQHNIKTLWEDVAFDDTYSLNTQSGTQWDGFRHVGHFETKTFYNRATAKDFIGADANTHRCSIHHWANHGIAGAGILLDYWHYAKTHNKLYDPNTSHAISFAELKACAAFQGLDLRPESQGGHIRVGDMLFIRSGFVERYYELSSAERYAAATRSHDNLCFAGVAREPQLREWLHDSYFAAVVGDSPTFEAWPVPENDHLHQSLLALWGLSHWGDVESGGVGEKV
ncbi:hypothetical protein N7470_009366 [Penicillium chermesinum]|nr:hypothetical protein N7470_009366 [Penicillium chermesinum]